MTPEKHDHDFSLMLCANIRANHSKAKTNDINTPLGDALSICSQVAGAYACNEPAMVSHISQHEFDAAIDTLKGAITN